MKKLKVLKEKLIKMAKGNSLRMSFLGFTLVCWIFPSLAMTVCGIMVYQNYRAEIETLMISETNYAGEFCFERLSSAYKDSSDSTYDKVVEDCYVSYLSGEMTSSELTRSIKRYTNNKYLGERFCMADVVFADNYNTHYYLSTNSLGFWYEYQNDIYSSLLQYSQTLSSKTGVYIIDNRIFLVRRLLPSPENKNILLNSAKEYGLFILQIDEEYLFEYFMSNGFWDDKIAFSINGNVGRIGKCPSTILEKAYGPAALVTDEFENSAIAGSFGTSVSPISLKYSLFPSFESIAKMSSYFKFIMFLILLLSFPLLGIGTFFFYFKINKPIRQLIKATQSIEAGNLGVAIEYEHEDEFKYLIENFNNMSREIKWLFDYTYKGELALKDARLLALQSQINPHFLNNTLEMMNWKARLSGQKELSLMIEALSTVMDAGMNRSRQQLVPLKEELKCVDAYIFIIHKRLGDRITVKKYIDQSLEEYSVPPLIIQPLVENAVVHGIEPAGGGTVTLRVYEKEDLVCVEVENDGILLTDEDVKKINHALSGEEQDGRKSLGIRNVDERLKLIYGGKCRLHIYRTKKGTTISKIAVGKKENAKIYN